MTNLLQDQNALPKEATTLPMTLQELAKETKSGFLTTRIKPSVVEKLDLLAREYTKQAKAFTGGKVAKFSRSPVLELLIEQAPMDFGSLVSVSERK